MSAIRHLTRRSSFVRTGASSTRRHNTVVHQRNAHGRFWRHAIGATNSDDGPSSSESSLESRDAIKPGKLSPEEEFELESRRAFKQIVKSMKETPFAKGQEHLLDELQYEDFAKGDLTSVFRKLADQEFGAQLRLLGETGDALTALIELMKVVGGMLLISSAVIFYSAEVGLHLDAAHALGIIAAFGLGCISRSSMQVDALLEPLNEQLLKILVEAQDEFYVPTGGSSRDMNQATASIAVALGATFILPQALFGWDTADALRFAVPFFAGVAVLDVYWILAFFIRYRVSK